MRLAVSESPYSCGTPVGPLRFTVAPSSKDWLLRPYITVICLLWQEVNGCYGLDPCVTIICLCSIAESDSTLGGRLITLPCGLCEGCLPKVRVLLHHS